MAKPTKWPVYLAQTLINLGICPVWSVFTVSFMGSWWPKTSQTDLSLRWVHRLISRNAMISNVSVSVFFRYTID